MNAWTVGRTITTKFKTKLKGAPHAQRHNRCRYAVYARGTGLKARASRSVRYRNHPALESCAVDHAVPAPGRTTRRGRQADDRHAEEQPDSARPGLRPNLFGP